MMFDATYGMLGCVVGLLAFHPARVTFSEKKHYQLAAGLAVFGMSVIFSTMKVLGSLVDLGILTDPQVHLSTIGIGIGMIIISFTPLEVELRRVPPKS